METEILKQYHQYTKNVSTKVMTISLELVKYMWDELCINKPNNILDLGSGFSSFVFRYYKQTKNNDCEVTSVDTVVEWLSKTKDFLIKNNLDVGNIYAFKEFKENKKLKKYDFILYDLGPTDTRSKNLKYVLKLIKPNCPIIIDDVHNQKYKKEVIDIINLTSKNIIFLNEKTFDVYGRFAALVK